MIMNVLGVLPARMAASRYPGKPLKEILGIPMIGHCFFRSSMCSNLNNLVVATCDQSIIDYIESINGVAILTSNQHERATERTAEALLNAEELFNKKFDFVVMIQGDEPLVDPEMISQVLNPLLQGKSQVSNLMVTLKNLDEIHNTNNVKVVKGVNGNALYMSREAIPSSKKFNDKINYYRQLGLIAFSREALLNFIELKPSESEIIESIDMNRFLENQINIQMVETNYEVDAVDVPDDLIRVEEKMRNDKLFHSYKPVY
jgi:3-deoxy-manno-octulosonate cytidylyltransferase (CMP-KDO synthetase)